jgi:glycosyltransferase involved in cell wall biosynthesis/SAM-dependent methyltransferase
MRLAWLSPLPPIPSGIADYSYELLPLLAERAEVIAVSPRPGRFRSLLVPSGVLLCSPGAFERRSDAFDAVFHHLGNNLHHEFVYQAALRHPGVAVFHELVLHHLLDHLLVERLRYPGRYQAILREEYGEDGERLADLRRRGVATDFEKFMFPLTAHVARRARAIVVHNVEARDRMREIAPDVPVTVIPHHAGSPPGRVSGITRESARRRLGIGEETFVVGCFGFITKPKQPAAVIGGFARVVAEHPGALLLMVGADHSGGGLDRLIERQGLTGQVRLAGFVNLVRFYTYLRAADVVVNLRYPNAGESSGTLARALAEGKPLVVNDVGSFAELPDEIARKVEIDEDQTDGVARELSVLASDHRLRALMGRRASDYADTVLNPARCRDMYLEVASRVQSVASISSGTRKPLAAISPTISGEGDGDPAEDLPPISGGAEPGEAAAAMPELQRLRVFLERIDAACVPPSGAGSYVDLLYRLLLRRPAEESSLRSALLSLAAGDATRADLARWIVESREFAETELIEKLLLELRHDPGPFAPSDQTHLPPNLTERVIEIPWVLSRWNGERRVLDLGYAFAPGAYLTALLTLPIERVHGADRAGRAVPGMERVRADLRALPYRDGAFDLVICISTIEHIGLDNTRYGMASEQTEGGDGATLREIQRILAATGRLLITVPFGRSEDHSWFVQYNSKRWDALLRHAPALRVREQSVFHVTEQGWRPAHDLRSVEGRSYGVGVPAAAAVLCADLVKG